MNVFISFCTSSIIKPILFALLMHAGKRNELHASIQHGNKNMYKYNFINKQKLISYFDYNSFVAIKDKLPCKKERHTHQMIMQTLKLKDNKDAY